MKRAIIVGATSGMGYDLAVALLKKGWKLGLAGRSIEKLQKIQETYGSQVEIQKIDVNQADCTRKLSELVQKLGGMDSYLHFSGIGIQNRLLDPQIENQIIQTNVVGFTQMIDFAYNWFKTSGIHDLQHKGHIVVVTSVASTRGTGIAASYTSSKKYQSTYLAALSQLAHTQDDPIQFTEIQPGFVATPMLKRAYPCQISRKKAVQYILKGILKKKRMVIFDWKYRFVVLVWRLIPRAIWEKVDWFRKNRVKTTL